MLQYALTDPALRVRDRVLAALSEEGGLQTARVVPGPSASDGVGDLKAALGHGAVLDFKTTDWQVMYTFKNVSRYVVRYSLRARLIRLDEGRVVWEGSCNFPGKTRPVTSTLEEMQAHSGAAMRQELNSAADACAGQLRDLLLGRRIAEN